jgi:hypothetical protein
MTQKEIIVPYDSTPHIHTGTFLTKEQAEQFKDVFKDLTVVARCKDCKHRPIKPNDYENGFDLEFPDNKCPCQNGDDGWYSWYPADNWYCAEGERRTE